MSANKVFFDSILTWITSKFFHKFPFFLIMQNACSVGLECWDEKKSNFFREWHWSRQIFWVMKLQAFTYVIEVSFHPGARTREKDERKGDESVCVWVTTRRARQSSGSHRKEYEGKSHSKSSNLMKSANGSVRMHVCGLDRFSTNEKNMWVTRRIAREGEGKRRRWNRFDLTYGYELNWQWGNWIAITIGILQIRMAKW